MHGRLVKEKTPAAKLQFEEDVNFQGEEAKYADFVQLLATSSPTPFPASTSPTNREERARETSYSSLPVIHRHVSSTAVACPPSSHPPIPVPPPKPSLSRVNMSWPDSSSNASSDEEFVVSRTQVGPHSASHVLCVDTTA
eukprot:TRINITY_DN5394_c0_g5_i1.p1 TRINITY_DN5394_c0_g5~~TRINITY_DN5394_c0_g5_i1.p1  ORF type:complete len:140 (+),score=32.11 TRINITY_DN5394_c0_g5_i1:63-482(+)